MSARPSEAAVGTDDDETEQTIDQAFDFLRTALKKPEILDHFPDKGTLRFRPVEIQGHAFQLTASRAEGETGWTARVSRYAATAGAASFQRPIPGVDADPSDFFGMTLALAGALQETGPTEEAALDALEARLRAAVGDAVRVDLDEIDRRHG